MQYFEHIYSNWGILYIVKESTIGIFWKVHQTKQKQESLFSYFNFFKQRLPNLFWPE